MEVSTLYAQFRAASEAAALQINVPKTLIKGWDFPVATLIEHKGAGLQFSEIQSLKSIPQIYGASSVLFKGDGLEELLSAAELQENLENLLQSNSNILIQEHFAPKGEAKELLVHWTPQDTLISMIKETIGGIELSTHLAVPEVLGTISSVRKILATHYSKRSLRTVKYRFILDTSEVWRFSTVSLIRSAESQRVRLRIRVNTQPPLKHIHTKTLKSSKSDRPKVLSRKRTEQEEIDRRVDELISKQEIPDIKHLCYSARAEWVRTTHRIDSLDLTLMRKIAGKSRVVKKQSDASMVELSGLIVMMREQVVRKSLQVDLILKHVVKFLLMKHLFKKRLSKKTVSLQRTSSKGGEDSLYRNILYEGATQFEQLRRTARRPPLS